jgi:hypothetical protein
MMKALRIPASRTVVVITAGLMAFSMALWISSRSQSNQSAVEVVDALPRKASTAVQKSSEVKSTLGSPPLRETIEPDTSSDIFSAHSWLPPPPPPPPPPILRPSPPPKPTAPALPFTYLGILDEPGVERKAFMTKGPQLFIAKTADVLDGQYRVDKITDTTIQFTYLPLSQQQSLSIQ